MTDSSFADTLDRMFGAAEVGSGAVWDDTLWKTCVELGLPLIGVPEQHGGSGGDTTDVLTLLMAAGRHAVSLPLVETGLAGWLLAAAGTDVPSPGPIALAAGGVGDTLTVEGGRASGRLSRVAWAEQAKLVVAVVAGDRGHRVVGIAVADAVVTPGQNLADEPRPTLQFDGAALVVDVAAPPGLDAATVRARAAWGRAALIAGALERVTQMTIRYTKEREQFGKPLARFQGVQQHLVTCAQESALVGMACAQAATALDARLSPLFEAAAAKSLAGAGADRSSRAAHQAHGAIGFTREYALQRFTTRLWSWKAEYGDQSEWDEKIGRLAAGLGADSLYPLITAGSAVVGGAGE